MFESLGDNEERFYDRYELEMEKLKKFLDRYLMLKVMDETKDLAAVVPTPEE